jgi:catechol-2,3-dioxygenase
MNRRKFINRSILTTGFLTLHDQFMFASEISSTSLKTQNEPRIKSVQIATKVPLKEMEDYYGKTLGLKVINAKNQLTVFAGKTTIIFEETKEENAEPWYHIAFNIPENKLWKARAWQLKKGPLKIREPGPNVDAKYPDVIFYPKWDAHSVFFWDPAGNLLEYIARHTLSNAAEGEFTSEDILYVSEVCFMSDDLKATAAEMKSKLDLKDYLHSNDHFHPIGDEYGLLINFPIGRSWRSNNNGGRKKTNVYPTHVRLSGSEEKQYKHAEYPFSVKVEKQEK